MRTTSSAICGLAAALVFSFWSAQQPARAEFRCGHRTVTYQVSTTGSDAGVRCVSFVDHGSFAWYGEGRWGGTVYRHLGYARETPPPFGTFRHGVQYTGFADDFFGNGETGDGHFPGTLRLGMADWSFEEGMALPPDLITVTGAWNEQWTRRRPAPGISSWTPLPPVASCGSHMRRFAVNLPSPRDPENLTERISVSDGGNGGVRCLLDADGKVPAVWFGEGTWGGRRYRHIGTALFPPGLSGILGPRWGSADICSEGTSFCGRTEFGGLNLRFEPNAQEATSIRASGQWNEWWDR